MKQKQHILVYPGGSSEVCKRKGEEYQLIWKDRTGFARMAMQHGYDIVPIVNVGGDDAYEIVKNPEEVLKQYILIGKFLKKTGFAKDFLKNYENIPPLAYGIGNTIFPKPVKLYYGYGESIVTKPFINLAENKEVQWQIRNEVELSMNKMMIQLLEYRANDTTKFEGKHREWFLK
jgi:1-acyl-sn-glycerol-3-phosphate acyltransferase